MVINKCKDYFNLDFHKTSMRTECIAGFTTFFTMAYIIVVNPIILSQAGMDKGAVFVATCLAAAFGSIVMGLYSNYPMAIAPSMGMNTYFTYVVVQKLGYSWQDALLAVFIAGIIFFLLSAFKIRLWLIRAIPKSIEIGLAMGIGLFLGAIALQNIGLFTIVPRMQAGSLFTPQVGMCFLGLAFTFVCHFLKIPGAILLGIVGTTLVGLFIGHATYEGLMSFPPSMAPTFLSLSPNVSLSLSFLSVVFTFFFVAFFDATGTLIGVLSRANLYQPHKDDKNLGKALISDSISTIVAGLLGSSPTGAYLESAAGVSAGGRTGLTSVVVGFLFFAALFFAPLTNTIPSYATAPALLFVACMMIGSGRNIPWKKWSESIPALVTVTMIPLTFSIAEGISWGFVSYFFLNLACRNLKLNRGLIILTGLCFLYLAIVYLKV